MRLFPFGFALYVFLNFGTCAWAALDDGESLVVDSTTTVELELQIDAKPPGADFPQELCVFLHKRGTAYLLLGRYDEAIADLKQALGMNQPASSDLWCDHWRLQSNLYGAFFAAGDWLVLDEYVRSVIDEYKDGNKWRYFSTQLWQVGAKIHLGRLRDAEQAFQRASDLLPGLRQQRIWTLFGNNVLDRHSSYAAWLQGLHGNYMEAERLRRQSLDYARAYFESRQARRSVESLDVRTAMSLVTTRKRQLAGTLTILGKTGEAEILVRQVLQETLSRAGKNNLSTAWTIGLLSNIKLQQGEIAVALRLREQALSALESSGVKSYSSLLGDMRAQVGFLLGVQNRWEESLKVYDQRDHDLRGNAAQFAKTGSTIITWAMALLKNGRIDDAEQMLREIIAWNRKKPFVDPLYFAHLRGYLGVVLVAAGKNEAALVEFRAAFPVLTKQAQIDIDEENGNFVRTYRLRLVAEGYLELLSRLAVDKSANVNFDPVAEAFQVAEVARGSSVQQAIVSSAARASLPDATLADLARREQDAANQISALNNLMARLADASDTQHLNKTIANMRSDVERLETLHVSLLHELAERYPAYSELVSPKAPTPSDLQKVLNKDEAAVALYVAEQITYVWIITPTKFAFRVVKLTREQIDKQVEGLRSAFDLSNYKLIPFDTTSASDLYAALLEPDEVLWADARLLNVIPHGALGQLPFSVLLTARSPTKDLAEQPWLMKKVAIAQQPSTGTLIALRARARSESGRRPFVGFGDPLFSNQRSTGKTNATRSVRNLSIAPRRDDVFNNLVMRGTAKPPESPVDTGDAVLQQSFSHIPPLPDTSEELNEIGTTLGANPGSDIFLGKKATEGRVKSSDLAAYQVVAFATHGLASGELRGLDQPSLALANPELTDDKGNDGFLTLSEVLGLKLNADWVVLSACNTSGGDGKNEEAVSGLGRAFFFSGTRRLLVSYWPVETVSARLLTTELFKRQSQHPEESKAEALRYSMRSLMNRSAEYSHPAYWAPFGLVGDAAK